MYKLDQLLTALGIQARRVKLYAQDFLGQDVPVEASPSGGIGGSNNYVVKDTFATPINNQTITLATTYTSAGVDVQNLFAIGLNVEATYNGAATLGLDLIVQQSVDNINWDTVDYMNEPLEFTAGVTVRKSFLIYTSQRYMRVLAVNNDAAQSVTAVTSIITEL